MNTAADALSASGPAPTILLVCSLILAIFGLLKLVPAVLHFIALSVQTFEGFVGNDEQPGVLDTLKGLGRRLDKVEEQLVTAQSLVPAVARVERDLTAVRSLAEQAAVDAREAKDTARLVSIQSRELSERFHEANELGLTQRGLIMARVEQTGDHILKEVERRMNDRTAQAFELLAEHGGPNLDPSHLPSGTIAPVPPHSARDRER